MVVYLLRTNPPLPTSILRQAHSTLHTTYGTLLSTLDPVRYFSSHFLILYSLLRDFFRFIVPWSIIHHNDILEPDQPSSSSSSTQPRIVTGSIHTNEGIGQANLILREPNRVNSSETLGPFGCVADDSISVRLEGLSPDNEIVVGWYVTMESDSSSATSDSDSDGPPPQPRERLGDPFNDIVQQRPGNPYSNGQGGSGG